MMSDWAKMSSNENKIVNILFKYLYLLYSNKSFMRLTAGVTCQQEMRTPPRHLIPPDPTSSGSGDRCQPIYLSFVLSDWLLFGILAIL
jgi:hypothetical protein